MAANDPQKLQLAEAIGLLKAWNRSSSEGSIATAIAIEFGYRFLQKAPAATDPYQKTHAVEQLENLLAATTSADRMKLLRQTL